ncbi:TPA: fimbrial protein [Salmonella enterica]|nr:fimbrial protein [Salmonella enterica]
MKQIIVAITLSLFFTATLTYAATLTLDGAIILDTQQPAVECIINSGSMLEVHFGTIVTDKIDGLNYLTDVPLTLDCSNVDAEARSGKTLTLEYSGTTTRFTADAIVTSMEGLGIELQQNGKIFQPGESLIISEASLPVLKAVPIKEPGKNLAEGNFEAFAILVAEYQ